MGPPSKEPPDARCPPIDPGRHARAARRGAGRPRPASVVALWGDAAPATEVDCARRSPPSSRTPCSSPSGPLLQGGRVVLHHLTRCPPGHLPGSRRRGKAPADFYSMFLADVVARRRRSRERARQHRAGEPRRLREHLRLVPPHGSRPHPLCQHDRPAVARRASRLRPRLGALRYRWMFPPEMRIVEIDADQLDADTADARRSRRERQRVLR